MKKLLVLALALMIITVCFVACGSETTTTTTAETTAVAPGTTAPNTTATVPSTTAAPELAYKNATELLQTIYEKYNAAQSSEDTMLLVGGGNINNFDTINPEGPGAFVALEDEDYNQNLGFPVSHVNKIASAAAMFNLMNSNTITCYAIQLTEGTDVDATITAVKENILNRQWACGAPEKLFIAKAPGNYIIVLWGVASFGGIVEPIAESFATSVAGSTIVVNQEVTR